MAAIFYNLDDSGIFKASAGSNATLVRCDLVDDLLNGDNLVIMTSVQSVFNETVQFYQSFDDVIHYYYFGKGLGSISMELLIFTDCSGDAPGVSALYRAIGDKRGKEVSVNFSNFSLKGVLLEFTINILSEPVPHFNVRLNLGMTDGGLPKPDIKKAC